ncbi:pullulanase [Caminicella sporogenes DSM 14501]|uniref:Pullulanase n=1 Tax=Caminicella sporogenes DSM 14501 TaxID=1121266 RepID=A0A1M6SWT3_9FIRM|nr:type I pullulanase [Caminicella sporogenes]SHK49028.1 pullulanase [Caminicella sporogenes DSM 14501]
MVKINEFLYEGDDLGATYNKDFTTFKVWAPTQEDVKVIIYEHYDDKYGKVYPMTKNDNGVWELELVGDYKNKYYNYIVKKDIYEVETPDPYTKGATVNGQKGMIVDFSSINPEGWENHKIPQPIKSTESIIYEMHIRDFSVHKSSGMKYKGKYLAFTEMGTKNEEGLSTGIAHLKELGITHIHFLPIFDFASVDEKEENEYNWGYDPYLYNVPEGSYSTNPYDGRVRIYELKKMIMTLHENDIRVIMDVVYNHTYEVETSPFNILVPKYYYRTDSEGHYTNGSGCGNEIASEKPMVRKFIIDSLKFWAKEYKIDGFRFDLMGLFDEYTVKEIERELREINPNILLYGEPWTGGISGLDEKYQFRKGKQRGMNVAVFNDDFRNAIKGDNDGMGLGFVNGGADLEREIKKGIVGSIDYDLDKKGFADEPSETVNYVSCHDNLILFDKIEKTNYYMSFEERAKMNKLALSIILTSQGIPFIQGGTEFLRTKKGSSNSYNAGDEINGIDWSRKTTYLEIFNYIKDLISLRKNSKVMTLGRAEDIRKYLKFIKSEPKSVAYLLTSPYEEDYRQMIIIHNANLKEIDVKLPLPGQWKVIANEYEVNQNGVAKGIEICTDSVKVAPLSTYILINI